MSIRRFGDKNGVESRSEFITAYPGKPSTNIDITSKLQVIQALDNGVSKSDLAKEYGVLPQTITDIYKQKSSIIKKYINEYNFINQVCKLNLEHNLITWFEQQLLIGNIVTEEQLKTKAIDILTPSTDEYACIDEWLLSFRLRHSIAKYTAEDICNEKSNEEWQKLHDSLESKDIYIGGVCALAYNLEVNSYLNRQDANNYVSLLFIVNTLGTDKREVVVVGTEALDSDAHVKSLPVSYYCSANSQVDISVIISYLTKWNDELSTKGKNITLVLNIPDSFIIKDFEHIKIITITDLNFTMEILNKLEDCFKYKYRKLQINKSLTFGKENSSFLDYLYLIGNAWYTVSYKFIQSIALPAEEDRLYFIAKDDFRLSHWCRNYNVQLNTEHCSSMLDKYISFDKELPCIYNGKVNDSTIAVDVLSQREPQSTSGMEAYQAMRRLVSYLQSENAGENKNGESIMKYAKYLENHLEYGALLQMHQIIARTNDSN